MDFKEYLKIFKYTALHQVVNSVDSSSNIGITRFSIDSWFLSSNHQNLHMLENYILFILLSILLKGRAIIFRVMEVLGYEKTLLRYLFWKIGKRLTVKETIKNTFVKTYSLHDFWIFFRKAITLQNTERQWKLYGYY